MAVISGGSTKERGVVLCCVVLCCVVLASTVYKLA
jgi:hypothetical protein